MLGRIETRTRDRMYCQTMRTVRDISRDDRARIATCSLRKLTDRLKENYSIDTGRVDIRMALAEIQRFRIAGSDDITLNNHNSLTPSSKTMTFTQVILKQFRFAKYQIFILNCMQILINKLKYLHLLWRG